MISRIEGTLDAVEGQTVRLRLGGGICIDAMAPAYLAERLAAGEGGRTVRLETLLTLEGSSQGTSFVPRLIGFESAQSRRFFEIFTTVKGLGSRRALRAMAVEPGVIAQAIVAGDHKALERLPEIGKRLAQTIVAELSGKVDNFALEAGAIEPKGAGGAGSGHLPPVARDAVDALLALGEPAADAERRIRAALAAGSAPESADELVAVALRGR
jgi:Holliday junction DNA helicase RuvA